MLLIALTILAIITGLFVICALRLAAEASPDLGGSADAYPKLTPRLSRIQNDNQDAYEPDAQGRL